MKSLEIEQSFLNYFADHDHRVISGSSIIPENDPSLLLINSGMAPMKPYFTGDKTPPYGRLANSQWCIRTTDFDDIGDSHHGTSFRMLGNWGFHGAYKDNEAIDLAHEFLTTNLAIKPDLLYASYFRSTDETPLSASVPTDTASKQRWEELLGAHRAEGLSLDNLWGPAGDSGPVGPCTEVFYDTKPSDGLSERGGEVHLVDDRHIEIWNAGVFMSHELGQDGTVRKLGSLSVDAGAGLERLAMVLQGADSIHEIDEYESMFQMAKDHTEQDPGGISSARILFDGLKTAYVLFKSGVYPGNTGKNYVGRRLLRRSFGILNTNGNSIDAAQVEYVAAASDLIGDIPGSTLTTAEVQSLVSKEAKSYTRILQEAEKFVSKGRFDAGSIVNAYTSKGVPLEVIRQAVEAQGNAFPYEEVTQLLDAHKSKS